MFVSDIIKQTRQATVLSQLLHNRVPLIDAVRCAYETEQDLNIRVTYGNLLVWLRLLKEETNGS
jgi:hypothetical protein